MILPGVEWYEVFGFRESEGVFRIVEGNAEAARCVAVDMYDLITRLARFDLAKRL